MRPSSLPMRAQCAQFESSGPTEQTNAGANRHTVFAMRLCPNRPAPPFEPKLLDEELEAVQWAVDYVKTVAPTSDYPLRIERKLRPLDDLFKPIFENGGTPDVTCGPFLFDLKSRHRDYKAQMAAYALGMIQEDGWPVVKVALLYTETKTAETFELTEEDCWAILRPILAGVGRPPTPCEYCAWCSKVATCPAHVERVNALAAGREDWKLEQYHASQITDAAEMGKALRLARAVAEWCESIEHHAKQLALKEGKVPEGFKLQSRQGNRFIASVADAFPLAGLPQSEFLKACDVKPTALFETYAAFHGLKKAAAERDLTTKLGDIIQRKPETQSLVVDKKKD